MKQRVTATAALLACAVVLLAACNSWTMNGRDAQNTGFNDGETEIGPDTVAGLALQFTVAATTPPAFSGYTGFVGSGSTLVAFDRSGVTNCGGTPKTCAPLWTAATGTVTSSPVVLGDRVYVAGGSPGVLAAFDVDGIDGCGGTPVVCQPLWTATGITSSWVFAVGDKVLAPSAARTEVLAFDAAGAANCAGTPTVCLPVWSTPPGSQVYFGDRVAAADGKVFVNRGLSLHVFDLGGVEGCDPTTRICAPLWTGDMAGGWSMGPPTITGGRVLIGVQSGPANQILAFDPNGVEGCSGQPKVCTSLWSGRGQAPPATVDRDLASAYGRIYSQTNSRLDVFDAATCSAGPCPALFRVDTGQFVQASVANHLLFTYSATAVVAVDADGVNGCSGTPRVCTPVWSAPQTNVRFAPAVYGGRVYALATDGLHVYGVG